MEIYFSLFVGISVFFAILAIRRAKMKAASDIHKHVLGIISVLIPDGYISKIQKQLLMLSKWRLFGLIPVRTWQSLISWQLILLMFVLLVAALNRTNNSSQLIFMLGLATFAALLPNVLLNNKYKKYGQIIENEMPSSLETIAFIMDTGLGFESAIDYLISHNAGPISSSFRRAKAAIDAGMQRENAYLEIAGAGSKELRTIIRSILLAEKQGRPIKTSILEIAATLRREQETSLEEAANRLPATMLMPIFIFIIPPILMIYLMPAITSLTSLNG